MNPTMKAHLKDQLLQALMHYLPMEVRKKIMMEVPAAYNDYYAHMGTNSVVVCYANNLTPVAEEPHQRITRFVSSVRVQDENSELPD